MLEKIGLGFQEFRYFKYKSAVENFCVIHTPKEIRSNVKE